MSLFERKKKKIFYLIISRPLQYLIIIIRIKRKKQASLSLSTTLSYNNYYDYRAFISSPPKARRNKISFYHDVVKNHANWPSYSFKFKPLQQWQKIYDNSRFWLKKKKNERGGFIDIERVSDILPLNDTNIYIFVYRQ